MKKKEVSTRTVAPIDKLILKNVYKSFARTEAVHDISFTVTGGEVFGLLGPNGSGKTTLIRMIMNILRPDSGSILLNGEERDTRHSDMFGYLPEERGLYPKAHVLDMLIYLGTLNHMARRSAEVEAIRFLDRLGMIDQADSPINKLSKGMQQKIQFAATFLHNPGILILDEPFYGLDPINQIVLKDILKEYKAQNKVIIISTHHMHFAEKICDHICFVNQGEVILDGQLAEIKKEWQGKSFFIDAPNIRSYLNTIKNARIIEESSDGCRFELSNPDKDIGRLITTISQSVQINRFETIQPSLNDIFIQLIQAQEVRK